jgi:hypothetical protein
MQSTITLNKMSEWNEVLEAVKEAIKAGHIKQYEIEGNAILVETEQGWSVTYREPY